jgi:hypothetical protein
MRHNAGMRWWLLIVVVACTQKGPSTKPTVSGPLWVSDRTKAVPHVSVETLEKSGDPADRRRAIERRDKACAAGDAASCAALADYLDTGVYVERDPWRAASLRIAACDAKQPGPSKHDLVEWLCCHTQGAMPSTPTGAVRALASAVNAGDEAAVKAMIHPKRGLRVKSDSSFDGEGRSSDTRLTTKTATAAALQSAQYEDYDMLECGPVTDSAATCKISDPIGFAATFTIRVEDGRAYVIEIVVQTWGHS